MLPDSDTRPVQQINPEVFFLKDEQFVDPDLVMILVSLDEIIV